LLASRYRQQFRKRDLPAKFVLAKRAWLQSMPRLVFPEGVRLEDAIGFVPAFLLFCLEGFPLIVRLLEMRQSAIVGKLQHDDNHARGLLLSDTYGLLGLFNPLF
jgi:hypothetical protein